MTNVPIYEQYEHYQLPFNVKRTIERMLGTVPDKYLIGLGSIVLTCQDALKGKPAQRMTWSRGKKISVATARGLYHPKWGSEPAWIELHIDSVFRTFPKYLLKFRLSESWNWERHSSTNSAITFTRNIIPSSKRRKMSRNNGSALDNAIICEHGSGIFIR
jgi:hypothetical protein